jgi:hypothetical protein
MKNRDLAEKIYSDLNYNGCELQPSAIRIIEQTLDENEWTPAENLPPVDESSEWNKDHKISKDYLCYSDEWGLRFGRYHGLAELWTVNGVHSSEGIKVEHYREINLPKK